MKLLPLASAVWDLKRAPWITREQLHRLQSRKLRRLVRHAYRYVPYYRNLFDEAGIDPMSILTLDDLERIPVSHKEDLQAAGSANITSYAFRPGVLRPHRTSGSTGRPFTICLDPHFCMVRKFMFARALSGAGYRPGQRAMMLGSGKPKRGWMRWHHASLDTPIETTVEQLNRFRPHLLYGFVTPIRQLALHIRETGAHVHRPHTIVSTAETADTVTRKLLQEVFGAELFSIYGLTEMGVVAWQCKMRDGAHLAEDTALVEFLPLADDPGRARIVLTNLEQFGTPFLRFEAGDIGVPGDDTLCGCGRTFRRLKRIEGRLVDCVELADGRNLSPYALTCALENLPGVERYQVVQNEVHRFTFRWQGTDGDPTLIEREAQRIIGQVLGYPAKVVVEHESRIEPPPGRKFRVVECAIAHPSTENAIDSDS